MAPPVDLGPIPKASRPAAGPRKILSLSGGGFRGLFTARVLELMEQRAGGPLGARFDLIGGTSIGGVLAIAIAAGVPAKTLREEIERRGPAIFRPRWVSMNGFLSARYDSRPLAAVIEAILGNATASSRFGSLPGQVLVVAVNQRTAQPKIFRSDGLADGKGDSTSVRDAALATSAAPTFFPAHAVDDTTYVDGGLIANGPELVLAAEAIRRYAISLDDLSVCVIGTAGSPRAGSETGASGKVAWIAKHDLVSLTIDAQALLAANQLDRLLPREVLRIDGHPQRPIAMDDASPQAATHLLDLADTAFEEVQATRPRELRAILGV
jgi:predicted acylesterase/phospholipase RssA